MSLSVNQSVILNVLNSLNNSGIQLFDSKEILTHPNPNDEFVVIYFNILPSHNNTVHRPSCTQGPERISLCGNFTQNTFSIGLIKKADLPKVSQSVGSIGNIGASLVNCTRCNP